MLVELKRVTHRAALGLSTIALLTVLPTQAANLITNGDFTQGNPNIPSSQAGYQAVAGVGTVPTGWHTEVPAGINATDVLDCVILHNGVSQGSSGDVCGGAESQNWGWKYTEPNLPAAAGTGNYFAMDGDLIGTQGWEGPLYQTINGLTAGQQYTLSFYASANQQANISGTVTAYWGVDFYAGSNAPPTTASSYTDPQGTTGLSPGAAWQLVTETFTATSSQETLAFMANSPEQTSGPPFALLADVQLTATPEPGTFMLLGLGLIGIPALSKFGKKKV
jgi:Carbohydrate binding domain/PEP-CTERM motif